MRLNQKNVPFYFWRLSSLILSTAIFLGVCSFLFYSWVENKKKQQILCLSQKACGIHSLNTELLIELSGLSLDQPVYFEKIALDSIYQKLQMYPIFNQLRVQLISPNIAHIEYCLREPIAKLGNDDNTGLDQEGILFPLAPFFMPQKIPAFYSSLDTLKWGDELPKEEKDLLKRLIEHPQSSLIEVIDCSQIKASHLGALEVVIGVKRQQYMRTRPLEAYENFEHFCHHFIDKASFTCIDYRIPKSIYIRKDTNG